VLLAAPVIALAVALIVSVAEPTMEPVAPTLRVVVLRPWVVALVARVSAVPLVVVAAALVV
jgi:hypothetical protein